MIKIISFSFILLFIVQQCLAQCIFPQFLRVNNIEDLNEIFKNTNFKPIHLKSDIRHFHEKTEIKYCQIDSSNTYQPREFCYILENSDTITGIQFHNFNEEQIKPLLICLKEHGFKIISKTERKYIHSYRLKNKENDTVAILLNWTRDYTKMLYYSVAYLKLGKPIILNASKN